VECSAPLDPNFQGWARLVADAEGRSRFRTIIPGPYPVGEAWSRPPHIHFKGPGLPRTDHPPVCVSPVIGSTNWSGAPASGRPAVPRISKLQARYRWVATDRNLLERLIEER